MALNQQAAFQIPNDAQVTEVTVSPTALYHYITDVELERIGDVSDNLPAQVCIGSGGTLLGSIPSTGAAVRHLGNPIDLFSFLDLVYVSVTLVSLSFFVLTGLQWFFHSRQRKSLLKEIRERPKLIALSQSG